MPHLAGAVGTRSTSLRYPDPWDLSLSSWLAQGIAVSLPYRVPPPPVPGLPLSSLAWTPVQDVGKQVKQHLSNLPA